MKRDVFNSDDALFRDTVRSFHANEVTTQIASWEARGGFEHERFTKAGAQGLLCPTVPEAYGGPAADLLYSAVMLEEMAPYSNFGLTFTMHSEIVTNYLLHLGSEHLKQTWLPRMLSGEAVGAA